MLPLLANRYVLAALFLVLMLLSAIGGYQLHSYQGKQANNGFYSPLPTSPATDSQSQAMAEFFNIDGNRHAVTTPGNKP